MKQKSDAETRLIEAYRIIVFKIDFASPAVHPIHSNLTPRIQREVLHVSPRTVSCNELIYSDTNCWDRRSGKRKSQIVMQREEKEKMR